MERKTLILMSIAVILWIIGTILLYKKGESNAVIISTGIIILTGFFTQIKRKKIT
jgi:low affinity Fe/Cu permease